MSNKNKQNKQNDVPTTHNEIPMEATAEIVPSSPTTTDLTVDVPVNALLKKYADALPEWQQYLEQVAPPTQGEIDRALSALPDDKRKAFLAALARMNPVKLGQHTSRREFSLPDIRVYHGTGNDEMRPGDCPTGGIYGTDGRLLAAPKAALANLKHNPKHAKLGTTVPGFVIGMHEAGTFWPPRSGNLPAGIEVRANLPICRTLDRKRGDYFGSCDACAYRPFKDGKPNKDACRNEDHAYFVLADFSGVYRIVFSSTSIKPGSAAIKKKSRPWEAYFSHPFELESRERTEGSNRWFELAAEVAADLTDPTGEELTLLNALTRQVDYEIFFPRLHAMYTTAPKASTTQGTTSDMDALLGSVGGPESSKKDVSGHNL
jgi:hypothetical protein